MPPSLALDIDSLQRAYARGEDPAAVIGSVHRRLAELDDPGIFIHLVAEADAAAHCRALPAFEPRAMPLWGIPFAVKDNIDVAGLPTTAACPAFAYMPPRNATVVDRLLAAGAILIGKTNLDQFATGLVGTRTPHRIPRNPFDARRIPGGSSSGSAVAVARGLASFALGTDTAGSGRVPAAFNGVVGLKPSIGAVPATGVVPACRTLDCVSVFATAVDDAWRVLSVIARKDEADPFSRKLALGEPRQATPARRIGVPARRDEIFFGDRRMETAWHEAKRQLAAAGLTLVEIDMQPFYETARLLYEGPWVAERYAAIEAFVSNHADTMVDVTRRIIEGARKFSAADAFKGLYRLAELRRTTEPVWERIDMLAVPSAPIFPTLAEVAADPIGVNAKLGTYTNFVNLLDLAALAIPGPMRDDGLPAGLTLIGPCASEARLVALAGRLERGAGAPAQGEVRPRANKAHA
ncbi:MAG: allophanate hydrolase [Hyphomicrobiales bacterium]